MKFPVLNLWEFWAKKRKLDGNETKLRQNLDKAEKELIQYWHLAKTKLRHNWDNAEISETGQKHELRQIWDNIELKLSQDLNWA